MWEVDIRKEWLSMQHQAIGKQVTCDPLERNAMRNTARPWWVALETTKELESRLRSLIAGCPASGGIGLHINSWETSLTVLGELVA